MVDAAKPTLGYWNIRACSRGNLQRYILGYAGVDYQETTHDVLTEEGRAAWGATKGTLGLDFPNLPYFIDGDFKLTESMALHHFLCEKYAPQLIGSTPQEKGECYMLQNFMDGWYWGRKKMIFANPNREECVNNMFSGDGLQKIVAYLGEKTFLTGDQVKFVDFFLYEIINTIHGMDNGSRRVFDTFPTLEAYHGRVKAVPEFAAFLASDKYVEHRFVPLIA